MDSAQVLLIWGRAAAMQALMRTQMAHWHDVWVQCHVPEHAGRANVADLSYLNDNGERFHVEISYVGRTQPAEHEVQPANSV